MLPLRFEFCCMLVLVGIIFLMGFKLFVLWQLTYLNLMALLSAIVLLCTIIAAYLEDRKELKRNKKISKE